MKAVIVARSTAAEYLRQDINAKSEAASLLAAMDEDSDDDVDDFIRSINKTVSSTKSVVEGANKYCFDEFIAPISLLQHDTLLYKNNPIVKPVLPRNCVNSDKIGLLINCFYSLDSLKFASQYNLFSAWSYKTQLLVPDYVMTALFENIFNVDDNNDIFNVIGDICIKNHTKWMPSHIEFKNATNNLKIDDDVLTRQSNTSKGKIIDSNYDQNQEILTFFNLNFIKNWLLMTSSIFGDNLSDRIGAAIDSKDLVQRLLSVLQCLLTISLDNSIQSNGETISALHIAIKSILMRINQYIPSNIMTCACCAISSKQEPQIDRANLYHTLVLNFWNNIISNKLLRLADLSYVCSMLPMDINKYLVHDIYELFLNRVIEEINDTINGTEKKILHSYESIMPMKIISTVRSIRDATEGNGFKVDLCLLLQVYILLDVIDSVVKNCGDAWFKMPTVLDNEITDEEDDDKDEKITDLFHQLKNECYYLRQLCHSCKNQKLIGYIDILEQTFKCAKKIHEKSV